MTSEPHRRAIGSLRAVALDAPDIDHLATFYEQLAAWRRARRLTIEATGAADFFGFGPLPYEGGGDPR